MTYHEDHYKLKRFYASEWESYKTIRLEALTTNPELFGSSYVNELTYSREKWISLLENESRAIFALYHLDKLIGLTGVVLNRNNSSEAILISSFIQKLYRGMGLSKLFFQARIDWARQKNCSVIVVSHRIGNEASKAANQRFGFSYTHSEETIWPDGTKADELMYELRL